jgi:hypothetical protein
VTLLVKLLSNLTVKKASKAVINALNQNGSSSDINAIQLLLFMKSARNEKDTLKFYFITCE